MPRAQNYHYNPTQAGKKRIAVVFSSAASSSSGFRGTARRSPLLQVLVLDPLSGLAEGLGAVIKSLAFLFVSIRPFSKSLYRRINIFLAELLWLQLVWLVDWWAGVKVGKGLSKDEKAQKLALQHWLEAIDPRHRYGHNLHYYYQHWPHCESKQSFFYWLDVGEGKEVNLEDHCPRWKLLQQCIRYLGPKERDSFEVIIEDRKLMYKLSRKIVDTSEGPKDSKWIFVLSTRVLYIGVKNKGTFQHSSFLAGGATSAAGRLIVEDGILKAVWPHSGHYRPTEVSTS